MTYVGQYRTPAGYDDLLLTSDGVCLTGLRFDGGCVRTPAGCVRELPAFAAAVRWLDEYFAGRPAAEAPPLCLQGVSPFGAQVLAVVRTIPYGQTRTYGEIARQIAAARGVPAMSAQAVGGALGRNPVCILIPCHRVIGRGGALTGYAGGLKNKRLLLAHERGGH